MEPLAILETVLYTPDLAAAARFYGEVLGLDEHARDDGHHIFYRCPNGMLLLFNPERTSTQTTSVGGGDIPRHGMWGVGHVAWRVTAADLPRWRERLDAHGVAIESEVTWPGGGHSIYFRDPAGNVLELATAELWGTEHK